MDFLARSDASDDAYRSGSINSKDLPTFWKASHAVFCWDKQRVINEGRIWSLTPDDPHLYPMPEDECMDIDTELEFEIAEALYVKRRPRERRNGS